MHTCVGVWVGLGVWVYGCAGGGVPVHARVSGRVYGDMVYGCVGVGGSMGVSMSRCMGV